MDSFHYLLMKTYLRMNRKVHAQASKLGLTSGQPKILEFLSLYGENEQKVIAEYCEIEPATVGSILLRMEAAGLVLRRNREGNRRSVYVSLTDRGKEMAESLKEIFLTAEKEIAGRLTEEELETMVELLKKCQTEKKED